MNLDGNTVNRIFRLGRSVFRQVRQLQKESSAPTSSRAPRNTDARGASYRGDYHGRLNTSYSPKPDGRPDPGEIVWTWVPFEEDYSRGKDRPVLLVGRDGEDLLGLMLTSKDHNNSRHRDERYVDIGSGPWDRQGRDSEVKVDRIIRVNGQQVRREGAAVSREIFDRVISEVNSSR
ncbi:type II toxin-antitoxin system PemK/MazF family toxin [Kocuria sp. HSID16901]|uniref:type II toxin-antitoxin system PemK/MazF family toxin n=1 Tax=Kocuria sp. HSID16901 TaxID=2419505 RepID=UPI000660588F|nr:type II toxin-antitoxin system PemK/MazF family toxin [Kocuria sp. HSID16901]RUQ22632.1 type II toxin-antitoxin system PemK/MazF family toxin [Kocuria sp. HSID16901]